MDCLNSVPNGQYSKPCSINHNTVELKYLRWLRTIIMWLVQQQLTMQLLASCSHKINYALNKKRLAAGL